MRMRLLVVCAAVAGRCVVAFGEAGEIGFEERFAWSQDRAAALSELIPGTEDFYFYHCLHAQNSGRLDAVEPLLQQWGKRHGENDRYRIIENRQALLNYPKKPAATLEFLRRRLGLSFEHQRLQPNAPAQHPSTLDPALVSIESFLKQARDRHSDLGGVEDAGLDLLIGAPLTPEERRDLLKRLRLADLPGVVPLVIQELKDRDSGGFGQHPLHTKLLRAQLDEVAAALKGTPREVLADEDFVNAYLAVLAPPADTDIASDATARTAHLESVWRFAETLPPGQNDLKVAVLYRLLEDDRRHGRYDRARFETYLRLPRQVGYIHPEYLRRQTTTAPAAKLERDFPHLPPPNPVHDDEPLVRDYLSHFLADAEDATAFAEWLEADYLRAVFAETKLLAGAGDLEKWYGLIPPARLQALRERVDIELLPRNRVHVGPRDAVTLEAAVKNVETLVVRIFEIDGANYYREKLEEITTAVDLDGIVPNIERRVTYRDIPPLRRHIEHFELAELAKPGLYVVEFVGNGVSSRALVRKGRLRFSERAGAAGHVFTVFDDDSRPLPGATLWMGGQTYTGDRDGQVVVPFSTAGADARPLDGRSGQIVLSANGLAVLAPFVHRREEYNLRLGHWLHEEQLLAGEEASLLLRPLLLATGRPASLDLIEDAVLEVRTTDVDGITSRQRVEKPALKDDEDYVHRFRVPPRLTSLTVLLSGKVRNLSMDRDDTVQASCSLPLNATLATPHVGDLFLRRSESDYWIDARGRNGEPLPAQPLRLRLKHRLVREPIDVVLQGDAQGRVKMGPLPGIEWVETMQTALPRQWVLERDTASYLAPVLHVAAGQVIELPAAGLDAADLRRGLSLLALAGTERPAADNLALARVEQGVLRISGLPAGDHRLTWRDSGETMQIRVAAGPVVGGTVVGGVRTLAAPRPATLQIRDARPDGDQLRLTIAHAGRGGRVHVLARRVHGVEDPASRYAAGLPPAQTEHADWPRPLTAYESGRAISDEARYVLDRRDQPKYAGNLLERPSLILNPWSTTATETIRQEAEAADAWEGVARGGRASGSRGALLSAFGGSDVLESRTQTLDFLPAPARLWANLRPDAGGNVSIPLADLAGRNDVLILAADANTMATRRLALPEMAWTPRDLRLSRCLDPAAPVAEMKAVDALAAGTAFSVADLPGSRVEMIDSLAKAFRLLQAIQRDDTFERFAFITRWPELEAARQRELYSEYACHELNFFLYQKDRTFFDAVVRPYLENKRDKQFLDLWLLERDLSAFLEPGAFQRLNTLEAALLARRLGPEGHAVVRHLSDRADVLPPDPEGFDRRFRAAIQGSSLDIGGGIAGAADRKLKAALPADAPAAPAVQMRQEAKQIAGEPMVAEQRAAAEKLEDADHDELQRDRELRPGVRRLYREPERTREWVENHYYQLPLGSQDAERVPLKAFWREYAEADPGQPFLSGRFMELAGTLTERVCGLAVLGLPFKPGGVKDSVNGTAWTATADTHAIVFHQQVAAAKPDAGLAAVVVVESFFDPANRHRIVAGEQTDLFVTNEFVKGRVYGGRVVLTNPTSSRRRVSLLTQIPAGAIAVGGSQATRSVPLRLEPYGAATFEYQFYFPEALAHPVGHYPATAAESGRAVGAAATAVFRAVEKPSIIDRASWAHISQDGSAEDVRAFLERQNVHAGPIDLTQIAWRMRDQAFFSQVLDLLERRGVYDRTLWSYAIRHDDSRRIRQFLGHPAEAFNRQCGLYLRSPLLDVDGLFLRLYEHKEYWPLINSRAHSLGRRRVIANQALAAQYRSFLDLLAYRPELDAAGRLELVAYLLLQDRVGDAAAIFERVRPDDVETRLQHAYAAAYLAFSRGDPARAGEIAAAYVDHPVERWAKRFRNVRVQADEIGGAAGRAADADNRQHVQDEVAGMSPSLDLAVEGDRIRVHARNIREATLRLYPMDIEPLFSSSPFIGDHVPGRFTFVRPAVEQAVKLAAGETATTVELPASHRDRNMIVEVRGGDEVARVSYTPHALDVQVVANYGQVRVRRADNGRPVAGAYVKVYGRSGPREAFHKDGYTDLRGVFDYASVSDGGLPGVERFAVLVLDEKLGAVVRQAAPPPR